MKSTESGSGLSSVLKQLDFSTRTKSGITNIATWMTLVMYGLYLNFYLVPITIPTPESGGRLLYVFLAFVPQAVKLIIFGGDSVSHANNTRSLFFQSQFPAQYVANRYSIELGRASFLWFKLYDGPNNPDQGRTTQYGYTCRLVYYLFYIASFFALLSIGSIGVELFRLIRQAPLLSSGPKWYAQLPQLIASLPGIRFKLLYFVHVALLAVYLGLANKVRVKGKFRARLKWHFWRPGRKTMLGSAITLEPKGVWVRWKEINERNRAWVTEEYPDLAALSKAAIHQPSSTRKTKSNKTAATKPEEVADTKV